MITNIKSGAWISKARIRNYSLIIFAITVSVIMGLVFTAHGNLDAAGRPLGIDFSQIWVAGLEALHGEPEKPFDVIQHMRALEAEFGVKDVFFIWAYPPFFLGLAAVFATLPYLVALVLWQLSSLAFYLVAVLKILHPPKGNLSLIILPALAFPAVQVNLLHGQTGFLTAALTGIGFSVLEKRPILSGICFGLLSYKPQLGLVLPIVLIAGKHWKTFLAAVITLLLLVAASYAAVDLQGWTGFFHNIGILRKIVLDQDGTGYAKLQSVFAGVRLIGGSNFAGYLLQSIVALMTVITLVWLWRSRADANLKKSAAITGTLLTTPYCFDYDLMILAPAIAFSVRHGLAHGFAAYEKTALAAAFLVPLLARPVAAQIGMPVGLISILSLFVVTIYHARISHIAQKSGR